MQKMILVRPEGRYRVTIEADPNDANLERVHFFRDTDGWQGSATTGAAGDQSWLQTDKLGALLETARLRSAACE